MNYRDKKVLIFGMGLHGGGVAAVKYFLRHGAEVTVTDLKSRRELAPSIKKLPNNKRLTFSLGGHKKEDFRHADIVVKGPGIPLESPYLKIAMKAGATITSDVAVFFEEAKGTILGVTGTKGKSTTTTLLFELCKTKAGHTYLGGNIRISVLDFLDKLQKNDTAVLELSSFQLETLPSVKRSPHISVITNLSPDHLDRYGSVQAYYRAKYPIFQYQKPGDFVVCNFDDKNVQRLGKKLPSVRRYWFSVKRVVTQGAYAQDGVIYFKKGKRAERIIDFQECKLRGEHNLSNALAAVAAARLHGVPKITIAKKLKAFPGIPYRLEFIAKKNGRSYYNDTTATNPVPSIHALSSFEEPIVLIAGGSEKNLNFDDFVKSISRRVKALVLLDDKASRRIYELLQKQKQYPPVLWAKTMKQAVRLAHQQSDPGDVVLLSPACASFGLFKNEFDRGDQFNDAVKKL